MAEVSLALSLLVLPRRFFTTRSSSSAAVTSSSYTAFARWLPLKDAARSMRLPSEGRPIGSAGPTTATRMDKYAPILLDMGEKAMIGKGKRSKEVMDAIVRNKAVYFAAVGGAGAILSKCIKKSECVCYEDLGAEAILKVDVEDFPVIVVANSKGNDLYKTAIEEFSK